MLTLAKLKQVVAAEKRKQSSSFVIPFIYLDRDKLEQELSEIYSQCEAVHFPTPYLRFKQLFGGWLFSIRKLFVLFLKISIQRTAGWELQNLIAQILFIPVWKTWNEQNLEHVENMQSCFCTYHRVCYKDKPCPKFNPTFARSGRREYRFSRPTAHGTSEQHFAIRMWRFPNLSAVSTSRENVRSCKNN